MAKLAPVRKSEFAGTGCLIQGVGLLLILFGWVLGPVGWFVLIIAGVLLLIIGGRKAVTWICPSCRNPLASDDVKLCPACKADFGFEHSGATE